MSTSAENNNQITFKHIAYYIASVVKLIIYILVIVFGTLYSAAMMSQFTLKDGLIDIFINTYIVTTIFFAAYIAIPCVIYLISWFTNMNPTIRIYRRRFSALDIIAFFLSKGKKTVYFEDTPNLKYLVYSVDNLLIALNIIRKLFVRSWIYGYMISYAVYVVDNLMKANNEKSMFLYFIKILIGIDLTKNHLNILSGAIMMLMLLAIISVTTDCIKFLQSLVTYIMHTNQGTRKNLMENAQDIKESIKIIPVKGAIQKMLIGRIYDSMSLNGLRRDFKDLLNNTIHLEGNARTVVDYDVE